MSDENEGVYVIEKNVKYQFKCMICMKRHDTYERATKCILRHSQVLNLNIPVKCPLCQSEVENKSLLNLHIELHHSDLQKSCCPECFDFFDYDHFSFYSARDQDNDMRKHFLKVNNDNGMRVKSICTNELGTLILRASGHFGEWSFKNELVRRTFKHR